MRIGCSKLRFDLCNNLHVINEASCACGFEVEDSKHFFLNCPHYEDLCFELFNVISVYSHVNIDIILHGNCQLTTDQNMLIFDAVHKFITQSRRFHD